MERLDSHFVCDLCQMENDADLDEYIQVTFTISPDIREITFHDPGVLSAEDLHYRYHFSKDVKPFPNGITVPRALQAWTRLLTYLEPGESQEVEVEAALGALAVRDVINSSSVAYVVTGDDPQDIDLSLALEANQIADRLGTLEPVAIEYPQGQGFYDEAPGEDASGIDETAPGFRFSYPAASTIPPGSVKISLHNQTAHRASAWVVQYPEISYIHPIEFEPVLTAKRLLSTQTFRQLFRSETVAASEGLHIKDLTYLFTDLKDSTAMYDSIGDANAYNLVRQHFDALVKAVAQNSGAVVKTIGDAIMATFVTPVDGVRASLEMLTQLAEFNQAASADLVLKIGLHRGHSLAVTLNDRIDYFGQTVNIAARVQQLAGAGEIVLSADAYESPGVTQLLANLEVTKEDGVMKGVEE